MTHRWSWFAYPGSSKLGSGSGYGRPTISPRYRASDSVRCFTRPSRLVPVLVSGRRTSYSDSPSSLTSSDSRAQRRLSWRYSLANSSITRASVAQIVRLESSGTGTWVFMDRDKALATSSSRGSCSPCSRSSSGWARSRSTSSPFSRRSSRCCGSADPSGRPITASPRAAVHEPSTAPAGSVSSSVWSKAPSTSTKTTFAVVVPRLAQAWSVPRCTTMSPAPRVTSESSRTRVISPSSTMP